MDRAHPYKVLQQQHPPGPQMELSREEKEKKPKKQLEERPGRQGKKDGLSLKVAGENGSKPGTSEYSFW